MKIISETDSYVLGHIDSHYFKVHYKSKELQLEDYLKMIEVAKEMYDKTGKVYLLYTQSRNFSIEKETWAYIKKNAYKYQFIGANALVVDDLAQRLMTKLFVFFTKDKTPTKIFSDPDKALRWLREVGA